MEFSALVAVKDYFKTKSKAEIFIHVIFPVIFASIVTAIQFYYTARVNLKGFEYIKVITDLISSSLTVVALFVSFSLACLTVLVSSNSDNITKAKKDYDNDYRIDGKKVTLFQLLLIDLTYTVLIQAFFIIILFTEKFFVDYVGDICIIIFLIIDLAMLLHVIILEIRNTNNIYMIFWKPV